MEAELQKLTTIMKRQYGKDVSVYDQTFLTRTLDKRCRAAGAKDISQYLSHVLSDALEADALYNSLHITYSQFFREPLTFAILEQSILPAIIAGKNEGGEIRIWSAGCSGGQEAFSVAMLISDLAQSCEKEIRYRIFATDIGEEPLAAGRAAVYNQSAVEEVREKHLQKYFVKQGNSYSVIPQLRSQVSFSYYDLLDKSTANPPDSIFGDFDIILCCNVLIYYTFELQRYVIQKLKQSLSQRGYLITGEAERSLVEQVSKLPMLGTPSAIFHDTLRSAIG